MLLNDSRCYSLTQTLASFDTVIINRKSRFQRSWRSSVNSVIQRRLSNGLSFAHFIVLLCVYVPLLSMGPAPEMNLLTH